MMIDEDKQNEVNEKLFDFGSDLEAMRLVAAKPIRMNPFNFRQQLDKYVSGPPKPRCNLSAIFGPIPDSFKLEFYRDVPDERARNIMRTELNKIKEKFQFKLNEPDPERLAAHWCDIHKREDEILQSLHLPRHTDLQQPPATRSAMRFMDSATNVMD